MRAFRYPISGAAILGAALLAMPASAVTLATLPFDPTGAHPVAVQVPNQRPFVVTFIKKDEAGGTVTANTADIFLPVPLETFTIAAGQSQCKAVFPNYGSYAMSFLARSNAVIAQIQVNSGAGGTTPLCARR